MLKVCCNIIHSDPVAPGGSVARGLPQYGQPVHVGNLHRDEKPSLPGEGV